MQQMKDCTAPKTTCDIVATDFAKVMWGVNGVDRSLPPPTPVFFLPIPSAYQLHFTHTP